MKTLEIDGITYAAGLSWHTASGPGIKRDINSFIASEGYSHGVLHVYDNEGETERNALDQITGIKPGKSYQVGATDDEDAKGLISLASLIARMTISTGLYCLTINDGEKWVLAVNGGEVVTSTDCGLADDNAREVLAELFEALVGTHSEDSPFVCIADDEDFIGLFSEHDESFVEYIEQPGKLLTSGLLAGDAISSSKESKIKTLENKNGLKIIAALTVLGGGYYAYGEYKQNKVAQERLRQQASRIVEQKQPEGPSQEELLAKAREDEIYRFNSAFGEYSNIDVIEKTIALVRSTPKLITGWEPQVAESSKSDINIAWKSVGGTPVGIINYLEKNFDSHNFNDRADALVSAKSLGNQRVGVFDDAYSMLPRHNQRIGLIDALKRKRGSWVLGSPEVPSRSSPIEGIVNPQLSRERQAPYRESEIKISGDGFHTLRSYYDIIGDNGAVKVKSISIDFSNNKWEVEGVYYDKI